MRYISRFFPPKEALEPDRSAINLGLWFWPVLQFLYSAVLLNQLRPWLLQRPSLTFIYDLLFLILLGFLIVNIVALYKLAKGKHFWYQCFYWTALPFLPFSLLAIYSLYLSARNKQKSREFNETLVHAVLGITALAVILILIILIGLITVRGLVAVPLLATDSGKPTFFEIVRHYWENSSFFFSHITLPDFLFSSHWAPTESPPNYGIAGFIWGSFVITFMAVLLATPLGLGCAIFIAEFAPARLARLLRNASELLAGIPSVVYGFFGTIFLVPLIRAILPVEGNTGFNAISAAIILALMILPTIINISEISLRSVPDTLRNGSLALGATKWQTVSRIAIPAAISGISTGIILGTCRAIGETLAVLMVAGNATKLAWLPTQPTRTLTMNIIAEMAYAQDDPAAGSYHLTSLLTTSIVLMFFILSMNILLAWIQKRIHDRFYPD